LYGVIVVGGEPVKEKLPLERVMMSHHLDSHVLHLVPLILNIQEHGEVSSLDMSEVAAGEEGREVEGCGRASHLSP
jgi:hypothetical protein